MSSLIGTFRFLEREQFESGLIWVREMYLRSNSRFRYVVHTPIHDSNPITTDPMTMCLQWHGSWFDLGRSRYAHADQLTFWVRSNIRHLVTPRSFSSKKLSWLCYSDGGASSAEMIAQSANRSNRSSAKQIKNFALSADYFGASSVE